MFFGLANAPATFKCFANDIFKDVLDQFIVIYLENILVFSENQTVHYQHILKVLEHLRKNGLYAKPGKT